MSVEIHASSVEETVRLFDLRGCRFIDSDNDEGVVASVENRENQGNPYVRLILDYDDETYGRIYLDSDEENDDFFIEVEAVLRQIEIQEEPWP